jgi:hypothetical protein
MTALLLAACVGAGGPAGKDSSGSGSERPDSAAADSAPADETGKAESARDTGTSGEVWVSEGGGYWAVSVGWYHRCALTVEGGVECWGSPAHGKTDGSGSNLALVATEMTSTCVVDTDGIVSCFGCQGENQYDDADAGQCEPPVGTTLSAIEPGSGTYFAVDTSGTAFYWGRQEGVTPLFSGHVAVEISLGDGWCIIDEAGDVPCEGNVVEPDDATEALGLSHLRLGYHCSCARTGEGAIACWDQCADELFLQDGTYADFDIDFDGHSACGVRDDDGSLDCAGPIAEAGVPDGAFTQVQLRYGTACAIRDDGHVVCWGEYDRVEYSGGSE